MKKLLLGTVLLGGFVSSSFADGQEGVDSSVHYARKLKVEIGGHIHRAFGMVDAGNRYHKDADASLDSNTQVSGQSFAHVDNINSQSRFHVKANAALNELLTVGTKFELAFSPNNSIKYKWLKELTSTTAYNAAGASDSSNAGLGFRQAHIYFSSPWATLTLGLANSASEDVTEQMQNGTYAADAGFLEGNFATVRYAVKDVAGGGNAATATRQTDLTVGNTFTNMDGLGRKNLIKIESAQFYGFKVAASHVSGGSYDASIAYDRDFEILRLKGKAAYARYNNNLGSTVSSGDKVGYRQWSGSISALFPFGLNIGFAAGVRNYENTGYKLKDADASRTAGRYLSANIGWQLNLVEAGKTCLNITYAQSRNNGPLNVSAGTEGSLYAGHVGNNTNANAASLNTDTTRAGVDVWSVTALQRLDNIGTEIYANLRNFHLRGLNINGVGSNTTNLDTKTTSYKDVLGIMVGARVKF